MIIRIALLMAVLLTVVFVSLYFYLRAGQREALIAEWQKRDPSDAANEHRFGHQLTGETLCKSPDAFQYPG